jgi:putative transposase
MQLVEQHVIRDADLRFAAIDRAAFASKNLYNAANYVIRQSFIHEGVWLNFAAVYHRIKGHEAYSALPRKVSNDVLRQLEHDWRACFADLEAWHADPSTFVGPATVARLQGQAEGP